MTPRQARYLARLSSAKDHLFTLIASLDEATICNTPVVGDWTVKDMLGHIVCWDAEFRREIQSILQGRHPGYEQIISGEADFDAWNQAWIAQKRTWSLPRMLSGLERDFEAAVNLILSLSPQDFRKRGVTPWKRAAWERPETPTTADTDSVETLVTYHWRHTNQHIRMIEHWLKQRIK